MNTKIASFVLALALAALACNALTVPNTPTPTPIPTATATVTPPPSVTPAPLKPRIKRVFHGLAYASQPNWNQIDPTDPYPHTRIPAGINVVEVIFFLELPEGWPAQKTELRSQWYRNGNPIEGSDSSLVCTADKPCSTLSRVLC